MICMRRPLCISSQVTSHRIRISHSVLSIVDAYVYLGFLAGAAASLESLWIQLTVMQGRKAKDSSRTQRAGRQSLTAEELGARSSEQLVGREWRQERV